MDPVYYLIGFQLFIICILAIFYIKETKKKADPIVVNIHNQLPENYSTAKSESTPSTGTIRKEGANPDDTIQPLAPEVPIETTKPKNSWLHKKVEDSHG